MVTFKDQAENAQPNTDTYEHDIAHCVPMDSDNVLKAIQDMCINNKNVTVNGQEGALLSAADNVGIKPESLQAEKNNSLGSLVTGHDKNAPEIQTPIAALDPLNKGLS